MAILIETKSTFVEHIDKSADRYRKRAGMDPLARHAEAIRELRQRTARDIIKIGEHLTAARRICGYGNWQPWLEREFGWTDDTARNFMRVFELSKTERVPDLNLPLRSLYVLARPSTPEAVRQEVFARAERGEPPSYAEVKAAVEEAKPKSRPVYKAVPEPLMEEEIRNQMDNLFRQLDGQAQARCVVDYFRQLDRKTQSRCALKVRNILQGRA